MRDKPSRHPKEDTPRLRVQNNRMAAQKFAFPRKETDGLSLRAVQPGRDVAPPARPNMTAGIKYHEENFSVAAMSSRVSGPTQARSAAQAGGST